MVVPASHGAVPDRVPRRLESLLAFESFWPDRHVPQGAGVSPQKASPNRSTRCGQRAYDWVVRFRGVQIATGLQEAAMRFAYFFIPPVLMAAGLTLSPTAAADCTSSAGTTTCSQGAVRGANTGHGPNQGGHYAPYACGLSGWSCNDNWGGLTIVIARPGRHGGGGGGGGEGRGGR
jgi:hypothetical protein